MRTSRLEAFSDGVLAVVITVMVLQLKVPHGEHLSDLVHTTGVGLLAYLLSFVYVGSYWTNHHYLFQLVRHVSDGVLWANLAWLFCLSLFPFSTAWIDESRFAQTPVVIYGLNLLAAAIAYVTLQTVIIRCHRAESPQRRAVGTAIKGKVSPAFYVAGILSALLVDGGGRVGIGMALACYVAVPILWPILDRRTDRVAPPRRALQLRNQAVYSPVPRVRTQPPRC